VNVALPWSVPGSGCQLSLETHAMPEAHSLGLTESAWIYSPLNGTEKRGTTGILASAMF